MRQTRRNRCDEVIALIDSCLAEYETSRSVAAGSTDTDRRR